ncbi:MAG: 7-cyano-7-deazaguanine synthase QueC [Elusimicrobiaceae bacterium]|nr:7-cyano-7-deazaguanine synthase QueC [Elusimicrobiaceae bacterium]
MKKNNLKKEKAVVLFSGGLDSTTCLYWALSKGYDCVALNISYGQKHIKEIACAKNICAKLGVKMQSLNLNLPWLEGATSLVGKNKVLPKASLKEIHNKNRLPSTYVPGRNLLFIALAASFADSIGATAIIAGPNAIDYSGYPDCRPQFYTPLAKAVKEGTSGALTGKKIKILTPLLKLSKAQIAKLGAKLKVPFSLTWTCYKGGAKPCGKCDACLLRAQGFKEAGILDK